MLNHTEQKIIISLSIFFLLFHKKWGSNVSLSLSFVATDDHQQLKQANDWLADGDDDDRDRDYDEDNDDDRRRRAILFFQFPYTLAFQQRFNQCKKVANTKESFLYLSIFFLLSLDRMECFQLDETTNSLEFNQNS